jgi:hypothetical protein
VRSRQWHNEMGPVRDDRCTTEQAKRYVEALLGEAELRTPGESVGRQGRPYFHYFLGMSTGEAEFEFIQLSQLPIQYRERDLIERMGLDGRAAN